MDNLLLENGEIVCGTFVFLGDFIKNTAVPDDDTERERNRDWANRCACRKRQRRRRVFGEKRKVRRLKAVCEKTLR